MAIAATTIWECMQNATANMVNGGGFNATNANVGTDYSQQTTAHLTITDLVIGADNTTVTSALTAFDSLDPGNILHITAGVNFTAGWYEVVSVTGVVATLDRACGTATSTGGTAYLGGALSLNSTLDDDFFEQCVAGNIVYIKYSANNYGLGEGVSISMDGTATASITVEGYNTTRGDDPTGTNRPTINGAANSLSFGDFWIVKNLIFTGTSTTNFAFNTSDFVINCKSTNTSATANRPGINIVGVGVKVVNCEGISTNGYAIIRGTDIGKVFGCYLHDSSVGLYFSGGDNFIVAFCIIDTCTTAIDVTGSSGNGLSNVFLNNTLYSGTTGINMNSFTGFNIFANNIISDFTTGATSDVINNTNLWMNNDFYNCTTDRTNVTVGESDIDVDPGFTDAPNGNFAISGDI